MHSSAQRDARMQRDRGRQHLCREEKGRSHYEGADEADERPRLVVVEPVVLLFKEEETFIERIIARSIF